MIFKRYSNPLMLMQTYSMGELVDFILYLYKQEDEEQLWSIWLHKPIEKNFEEFKKSVIGEQRKKKRLKMTKEEEETIINNSMRFITPRNKGGEENRRTI